MAGDLTSISRSQLVADLADSAEKLGHVESEISSIKAEMAVRLTGVQADAQRLRTSMGQLQAELSRRESVDAMVPTISDHALLRYIERLFGADVQAMKAELLTPSVIAAIKAGATGVKSPLGTLVIRGSTVVTFLSAEMNPKRKTKRGLARQHDQGDDEGDDEGADSDFPVEA